MSKKTNKYGKASGGKSKGKKKGQQSDFWTDMFPVLVFVVTAMAAAFISMKIMGVD